MVQQLGAQQESHLREVAALARMASDQRIEQDTIASTTQLANDRARAELERQSFALEQDVAARRRQLEAEREKDDIERERSEAQHRLELQKIELEDAADAARNAAMMQQQCREDEALERRQQREITRQRHQVDFDTERTRKLGEAERDAILSVTQAENSKTPAFREQQMVEHVANKVSEAISSLPIQDVHWSSWSGDQRWAIVGQAIASLRASCERPDHDLDT